MRLSLEKAVKPHGLITVDDKDYTVEFPLSAVATIEAKLGLRPGKDGPPVRSFEFWWELSMQYLPAVLEAGLSKHHPDVTAEFVTALCDALDIGSFNILREELCRLNFPHVMNAWDKARALAAKQTSEAKAQVPNVQSGAAA